MAELDAIISAVEDWSERGASFALATVVGVRGSTYRGLAARQLIGADGTSIGTVSGGCLDHDLASVADRVIRQDGAALVEFDLTADDEAVWGWGIGCNGATEVLVEPAEGARQLAAMVRRIRTEQRPAALVHTLSGGIPGRRSIVTQATIEGSVDRRVAAEAREAIDSGWHRVVEVNGQRLLIEVVGAPSRLVVFGAGHDAVPLVRLAGELGFDVSVADERRQFLTEERFPTAKELVHVEAASLAETVGTDRRTYFVLMSHNYLRDLAALRSLSGREVAYIGALGPGERLARLLSDLERSGGAIEPADLAVVHGPAGLDVGAEGPVEIALAVLAEIMAVRRGKSGGRLRERKGPAQLRSRQRVG